MTTLDRHTGPQRSVLGVAGRAVTVLRGGTGEPVLYLHGLCDVHAVTTGDSWTPFLDRFAAHHDVVAPGLPGYDGSTGLDELDDVEDYVWHLVDFFDAMGFADIDVVGHSLGGWFAAELALRHPERVRRLVLLGPLGLHVGGVEVTPFFGAVAPRGIGGMGEARRLLFADAEGAAALEALPDAMTTAQQLLWFGGLAGAARLGWKAPHFQSRKLTERLHRLGVPTLVVRGGRDVLVPEETAAAWVAAISGARRIDVPDAGHCLVLERPEVVDEVEGFLAGPV